VTTHDSVKVAESLSSLSRVMGSQYNLLVGAIAAAIRQCTIPDFLVVHLVKNYRTDAVR
jgi:hypothetical protein